MLNRISLESFTPLVWLTERVNSLSERIANRSKKPQTVEIEVVGPLPRTFNMDTEEAEAEMPEGAHYFVPQKGGKGKYMYCVFESGGDYYPIPLDRRFTQIEVSEIAEKPVASASQVYHLQKKHTMHRRYMRRGSAMEKVQATMYVCLAGGLGFLLFVIFSEVTKSEGM